MSEHHDTRNGFNAAKIRWFESLLEANGLLDPGEVDTFLASYLQRANPGNGARLVARAWVDLDFKERLLTNASSVVHEVLSDVGTEFDEPHLTAVENTAAQHNVLVCTLCSCYPIWLLGPSPSWYKSVWYRSRVVRDPRAVLAEFGYRVPDSAGISVWDSSSDMRYMVLPERPSGTEDLTESQLAELVTRNGLIGVSNV